MIAARMQIGTICNIHGLRGTVCGFLGNGRLRVCICQVVYVVDASDVWPYECQYNVDVAEHARRVS